MSLIADSEALAAFCARQAGAEYIALDTEFMRDTTYWPKLCLVQVGGPKEVAAIDVLAPELDLAPLLALLCDEAILKVLHSARQDLEIFYHMMGRLPAPVFDTQLAAMVCGFGESAAFQTLARELARARVDKTTRFADWSHRPLTQRQLNYALDDVIHLRPIYEKLKKQLLKNGRALWLSEEMATLVDPETYKLEPMEAWKRLKSRTNDRKFLAILQALAAWREREAQRRDVPRNRILRDEQLLDIAGHAPTGPEQLARSRGINEELARGRMGKAVLNAVAEGLALPEEDWPGGADEPPPKGDIGALVEILKVLLKAKCQEHRVAQKLVANVADLEALAIDDEAQIPALQGWRRHIFGDYALALKEGRLALTCMGREVVLIPLNGEQEPDLSAVEKPTARIHSGGGHRGLYRRRPHWMRTN